MLLRPASSARQKKIRIVTIATASCAVGAITLLGAGVNGLTLLVLAGVVIGNAGFAYIGWPASDQLPARDRHGRDGAAVGPGLEGMAGSAPTPAAGRPLVLWALARLMPRAAGRRWLAEADSLLSEVAADRRGKAIRSYLLSAPRLVVLMWTGDLSRRAWLRFRRPR